MSLALLVCLHHGAAQETITGPASSPDDTYLALPFSPHTVAVWTRAYVLQELEQLLQSTARRWGTIAGELAARDESTSPQFSAARIRIAATLRDVRRERATQLRAFRRLVGRAALPRRIRSPEAAFAPPWPLQGPDDPRAAIGEVDAVRLDDPRTLDPAAVEAPTDDTDAHVFTRLDALIHLPVADPAPGFEPAQELARQTALAAFHRRRRAEYVGVLVREAEHLRRDALAAWRSRELGTGPMLAAELEALSVEVAALAALCAYEAALARIQAIVDRA